MWLMLQIAMWKTLQIHLRVAIIKKYLKLLYSKCYLLFWASCIFAITLLMCTLYFDYSEYELFNIKFYKMIFISLQTLATQLKAVYPVNFLNTCFETKHPRVKGQTPQQVNVMNQFHRFFIYNKAFVIIMVRYFLLTYGVYQCPW